MNVRRKAPASRKVSPSRGGKSFKNTDSSVGAARGVAARRVALDIIDRVEVHGAWADVLLGRRLSAFEPADRRLVTRLVLGTIAWRGRLDYELERLVSRPLAGVDSQVLNLLRLGLFQLRFLDGIPAHAAVDTAVQITKECRTTQAAAGMVNAVLRRATRSTPALPVREADELSYLSIVYSHPLWLVERLVQWFGMADAERLMECNNGAAPNVARLNLSKGTSEELLARLEADGIRVARTGPLEETVVLQDGSALTSPARDAGLFHAQAEASQMVARMLAPPEGATALDSAAAPGGKTTHLSELVGPDGLVFALDMNLKGLLRVRDLACRLGHRSIFVVRADASRPLPLRPQSFRYVLLDAPCTGLGTLREHPEIRWRLASNDPARLGALQGAMLDQVAEVVVPGGVLVYAVCSFAPEETTDVMQHFLESHRQFALDAHPPIIDRFLADFLADGTMLTRPDRGARDGFFAARLIRRS